MDFREARDKCGDDRKCIQEAQEAQKECHRGTFAKKKDKIYLTLMMSRFEILNDPSLRTLIKIFVSFAKIRYILEIIFIINRISNLIIKLSKIGFTCFRMRKPRSSLPWWVPRNIWAWKRRVRRWPWMSEKCSGEKSWMS